MRPRAPTTLEQLPGSSKRPRREETSNIRELRSIARFLKKEAPEGVICDILTKAGASTGIYIIDHTLHIHTTHLLWRDELNFIRLVTSLRLVSKVRLHTFHLHHYRNLESEFVQISGSSWETVKPILSCINPGPREINHRKVERVIEVTFDDFLYPVLEASRAKKPLIPLISRLPASESTRIITTFRLPPLFLHLQRNLAEADQEVDVEQISESEDE